MDNGDYYEILGVDESADSSAIKDAYRKLALKYHPDRNGGNTQAAEKMKAINEAYAVLSHPHKRQEYDTMKHRYGSSAYTHFRHNYSEQDIFSGSDIDRIFEELSRSFGLRGFDEIFREARANGTHAFKFYRNGAAGHGYIFTSGFGGRTNDGKGKPSLRFPPKGLLGKVAQYAFKALSGLEVHNKGKDIVDIIRLSPHKAHTGGPHEYTNWRRNKKIVIRIPPNIREGQKIRITGQGEEGISGAEAGDLYLKVHIKKPIFDRLATMISPLKK